MKKIFLFLALSLVFTTTYAQSTDKVAKKVEKKSQKKLDKMTAELDLTTEQAAQVKEALIKLNTEIAAIRASDKSEEAIKAETKALNRSFKKDTLNSILTKEQKDKAKAAKAAKKAAKKG